MKKNIIYSLSLFLLLSLSACNQWLEVEPKTEIKSDKMFENETGFRDALIGCYMMMADSTLYGLSAFLMCWHSSMTWPRTILTTISSSTVMKARPGPSTVSGKKPTASSPT